MGQPLFRRSLCSFVSATACLILFGCGGSSTSSSATVDPHESGAAGSSSTVAGASSNRPANSNGAGGSGTAQVSGGGFANAPAAGASQAGSSATNGGIDFSHGSRLLIPQRTLTSVHLGSQGSFTDLNGNLLGLDALDVTTSSVFADAASFPRQFEVNFDTTYLVAKECQLWPVTFELSTLAVKQDVNGSGAHLKIEQVDNHYVLTHDGPGAHQIRVTGVFRAEHTSAPQGAYCPSLPMGAVSIPVAFTTNISIVKVGSVKAAPPTGCAPGSFMLSGHDYPGSHITLLDESGQPIPYPANVLETYPLDVLVETEKPAQIAEPGTGLGFTYDGLIVTGEPQTVRLSTSYGPLFTYQLADAAMIDDWAVEFWARDSQYVKSSTYPLAMDGTPIVAPARVIGATASLKIGGLPLCGPTLVSDFSTGLLTPDVCKVQIDDIPNPNFVGTPGFLATFVDDAGTCEFDLSVRGANGERGLKAHFSATLSPTAQAPF